MVNIAGRIAFAAFLIGLVAYKTLSSVGGASASEPSPRRIVCRGDGYCPITTRTDPAPTVRPVQPHEASDHWLRDEDIDAPARPVEQLRSQAAAVAKPRKRLPLATSPP